MHNEFRTDPLAMNLDLSNVSHVCKDMIKFTNENGVNNSRMVANKYFNLYKEEHAYHDIDLQTQFLYVAGREPSDETVEKNAPETQLYVSQNPKLLEMTSAAK